MPVVIENLRVIRFHDYEFVVMGSTIEIRQLSTTLKWSMPLATFIEMAKHLDVTPTNVAPVRHTRQPLPILKSGGSMCIRCTTTGGPALRDATKPIRYMSEKLTPKGPYCKTCYNYAYDTQIEKRARLNPEEIDYLRVHHRYHRGLSLEEGKRLIARLEAESIVNRRARLTEF